LGEEIIRKSMSMKGLVGASIKSVSESDLQIINSMTRREFTADELYVFPVLCCDTRLDRDGDRFTKESLDQMAAMAKGVTVIFDHSWSAYGQTARLYKAEVRQAADGEYELVAWAYMPKNEKTQAVIDAIDAGILKEVSVGFAYKELQCSICKQDYFGGNCPHYRGREYDGQIAFTWINGVAEWYELSFVAVPAQPRAGVQKNWRQEQEDAKRKRLEGGSNVEKLLEYLKSLGMEVKDDDHALSIVKEWKEKADGAEKAQEDLAATKTALTKAEDDLKAAQEQLKSAPDAAMAAAGQKFFETVRNEIVRLGGILGESTKSLEIITKGVTDIDALLDLQKEYQDRVDKKFPLDPQSKSPADTGAANTAEVDLKAYQV
jgi:phage head maturation protease